MSNKYLKLNKIGDMVAVTGSEPYMLADYLDRSVGLVDAWCKNRLQPTLVELIQCAEFFNVNVHDLLEPTAKTMPPL